MSKKISLSTNKTALNEAESVGKIIDVSAQKTDSMLKVLDYTKTNKKWFDDKELYAGYHSVTIQGEKFKGQRDPEIRLAKIDYDFTDKRVMDVGCNNGSLLHSLSDKIQFGVGVDFNAKCINAANALKAVNKTDNIHFYTFDLDKEEQSMLRNFVLGEKVDVCFFLNISIWVKRWKEAFNLCAELTEDMIFEAHGSEKQQAEQLNYVKSIYQDVRMLSEQSDDDPTYAKRKMYHCEGRIERQLASDISGATTFLKVYSEEAVKEAYQATFSNEQAKTIHFYPNTHESVVAEINDEYIVKFPKPNRKLEGISAEQAATDLLRDKVTPQIPLISIHKDPFVLARYQKLPGSTMDKVKYSKLPEADKQALANEFADFICAFHAIPVSVIEQQAIPLAPSWDISSDLIEQQLTDAEEPAIKNLLQEVVNNHKALEVPESNRVFGHFDLHGGNVLLNDQQTKLLGVIDFGNCKIGDLHQDLSVMNLSSTDLAERIALHYEQKTDRKLNRLLIQHYTTVFYLNLLAGLKRKQADKTYNYWLSELNKWHDYLLKKKARQRLQSIKKVSAISNHWRKWIVSNLMKDGSEEGVRKVLREQNFSELDIATELLMAKEHPYTEAGREIAHTLKKRNWLMQTYDELSALDGRHSTTVEVRQTPDFETFIKEYYSKQLPVVLQGGIDHWLALKKWTPEYLVKHYGDNVIEVQSDRDCDPLFERNSGSHKKKTTMKEFVSRVQATQSSNDFYMTANNTKNSMSGIADLFDDVADFGEGYRQADTVKSGNFFWFGPKGIFTPNHHDLTNNMLVQIHGRKKVTLIPGLQVPNIYNDAGVFSASDFPDFDEKRHPLMKNITPMEVILNPGDALFIPIGCWHCVEGLDVSISISFTNFNAPNQFSSRFPRSRS